MLEVMFLLGGVVGIAAVFWTHAAIERAKRREEHKAIMQRLRESGRWRDLC
jgi:hypothetical protein